MTKAAIDTINGVMRHPAPWNLTGRGYIILYRFPKDFIIAQGLIPTFLGTSFTGGLGAVMLVDYTESNVGPYGELLFIPGRFHFRGKKLHCITKIYVSTRESVENGWENWAIPKELADFHFTLPPHTKRTEKIFVAKDNEPIIGVVLKHGRLPFPIHTKLIPFPLLQEKNGKLYYTGFTGKGIATFARIEDINVNPRLFPDITSFRPFMAVRIDNFAITFPPPHIRDV
jgi:hypothetical protein